MPRWFNTAGPCKPGYHYMLPPARQIPQGVAGAAIYAVWFGFLAALYPVCRWVGQRGRRW